MRTLTDGTNSNTTSFDFFKTDGNNSLSDLASFESSAKEIIHSTKWEEAKTHLSLMNIRLIETLSKGKAGTLSQTMLDYVPHALHQATLAMKIKTKKQRTNKAF